MSQTTLPRPPRPRPSDKNEDAAVEQTKTPSGGPEAFAAATESDAGAPAGKGSRRRVVLVIVGIVVVIAAIAATIYLIDAAHYETTDDAYLEGHVVPISAEVAARVASVQVDDNQLVHKGDVIVQLDPTDYQVALEQAKASLASFEGKLTEARAQVPAMSALRDEARAELDAAQTNFANVDADLKRYLSLDEQARSRQQIDNATAAQKSANAQVAQAQAKLTLAESQIATANAAVVAAQGDVAKAASDVKRAEVNLGYCTIQRRKRGALREKRLSRARICRSGRRCWRLCRMRSGWSPISRKRSSIACESDSRSR